jgi:hypothetical protein
VVVVFDALAVLVALYVDDPQLVGWTGAGSGMSQPGLRPTA